MVFEILNVEHGNLYAQLFIICDMKVHNPAKINLYLDITGKRDDGFHELETLMTVISLSDRLMFEDDSAVSVKTDHPDVPDDCENIVYQAVECLKEHTGVEHGIRIRIDKQIPPESGLGGGSSNAAYTLMTLNDYWDLELSSHELTSIGAELGSDVNFFLNGPAAICRGRGEQVASLSTLPELFFGVFVPEVSCETASVYHAYDQLEAPTGDRQHPEGIPLFWDRLRKEEGEMPAPYNALREAAFSAADGLRSGFQELQDICSLPVEVTGSGSSMFVCHRNENQVERDVERVKQASIDDLRVLEARTIESESG